MKLRFALDDVLRDHIEAQLVAGEKAPVVRHVVSHVYLDTPDCLLASHGVALRFKRLAEIASPSSQRRWTRQELRSPSAKRSASSIKQLGIARLKARLDAAFAVRIERLTWTNVGPGLDVSLDDVRVTAGRHSNCYSELRLDFRKAHADFARRFACRLGCLQVVTHKHRDRGLALLAACDRYQEMDPRPR